MGLLLESKRMWLLSYIICSIIPGGLYYYLWDNSIAKTIGILFFEIQAIMFVFFLLILFFRWKAYCRTVATVIYIGITVYEGMNGNLQKWYIIVPILLITEIYMLWNLGGVINCVISNPYRKRLNKIVSEGRYSYGTYVGDLDEYNCRNKLGFFSKVHKKREPNWKRLGFNYTALEMFYFEDAMTGIDTSQWDRKEKKLSKINNKLVDKKVALDSNRSLFEEKESLERIISKGKSAGLDTLNYDLSKGRLETVRKKNIKKEKRILRKKL